MARFASGSAWLSWLANQGVPVLPNRTLCARMRHMTSARSSPYPPGGICPLFIAVPHCHNSRSPLPVGMPRRSSMDGISDRPGSMIIASRPALSKGVRLKNRSMQTRATHEPASVMNHGSVCRSYPHVCNLLLLASPFFLAPTLAPA